VTLGTSQIPSVIEEAGLMTCPFPALQLFAH